LQTSYNKESKKNKTEFDKLKKSYNSLQTTQDKNLKKLKLELETLKKSYKSIQLTHKSDLKKWTKLLNEKPKVVEVIKEVEVEVIKEVEVVKSFDMAMLQKMMKGMKTVQVSKTVVGESRTIGEGKVVERREIKPGTSRSTVAKGQVISTKKSSTKSSKSKTKSTKDDLTKIEGIGPAINKLLNADGIYTFFELSEATNERLKTILINAGSRFQMHDPGSWPKQSKLAADEKWDELKELQDKLDGGK